ncbi:MAG: peptide chain release factor 3 [Acidimicrobiia bacterium]
MNEIEAEAARRRTFAIISHPDAGKTTLTEKFLLYAGAIQEAGAVKARAGRRKVTSDWMAMEQQRGISITSTVLQFSYRNCVLNLLDTPGHRDFSEDTFRVLTAADAAIMVLDSAKGIEAQTLKLFEVCRARKLPVFTFLNKYDRPGRDALELLDEIESTLNLRVTPVTWPVGIPGDFRGIIDRRDDTFTDFGPAARGSSKPEEEVYKLDEAPLDPRVLAQVRDEVDLLAATGATHDEESFLAAETSPLFVGSAITNFGVRHLLDAMVDLGPSPASRADRNGTHRAVGDDFSGFVFKIQANMNPTHRDYMAFVRIGSGKFTRGDVVTIGSSGKTMSTKHATSVFGADRMTVEDAYPGDVIGLVNAGDLRIGESVYVGAPVSYPPMPTFEPELFARVAPADTSKAKQFRRGLEQLEREGAVQVLHDPDGGAMPVLAAVGQMQFEVFEHRLASEFGAPTRLTPLSYTLARRTDEATAEALKGVSGVRVFSRGDGTLIAAFESDRWLARLKYDNPTYVLEPILEGADLTN